MIFKNYFDINWIYPSLGIPNYKLTNLFFTLEGDPDFWSPRQLTPKTQKKLDFFMDRLQKSYLFRFSPGDKVCLILLSTPHSPTAVLTQLSDLSEWYNKQPCTLVPYLELIADVIIKGRLRAFALLGYDPDIVVIPFSKKKQESILPLSDTLQRWLIDNISEIPSYYLAVKNWDFFRKLFIKIIYNKLQKLCINNLFFSYSWYSSILHSWFFIRKWRHYQPLTNYYSVYKLYICPSSGTCHVDLFTLSCTRPM